MDQAGSVDDASGLWPNVTHTARRPTRPPKDPLLSVQKHSVGSIDEFEATLRRYLDNPPGDPEHAQCEIEVWGGAEVLVSPLCYASVCRRTRCERRLATVANS